MSQNEEESNLCANEVTKDAFERVHLAVQTSLPLARAVTPASKLFSVVSKSWVGLNLISVAAILKSSNE